MAVVIFSFATFTARYPEFSAANSAQAQACFYEACTLLDNTDNSPVTDVNFRTLLLNALTAHIMALGGYVSATASGPAPVGRLGAATEGTVNATLVMGSSMTNTAAWYQQTQYGAAYWRMTAGFRSMRYRAYVPPMPIGAYRGYDC